MTITVLKITGMSCKGCADSVNKALSFLPGIAKIDIDLTAGSATLSHNAETTPVSTLIKAIEKAGFGATES